MSDWSIERFGPLADDVEKTVTRVLRDCHVTMAAAHARSEMDTNDVYGPMWIKVHQAMVPALAAYGGRKVRPTGARYQLSVIGNVVIFPIRYARDLATDVDDTTLGNPVSSARLQVFSGQLGDGQLPMFFDSVETASDGDDDESRMDAFKHLMEMLDRDEQVVVVAFASSPSGLHRAYWGDADLNDDGSLVWGPREELALGDEPAAEEQAGIYSMPASFAASAPAEVAIASRRQDTDRATP